MVCKELQDGQLVFKFFTRTKKLEEKRMYIIKNAFRNIMRTKGRNVLIGIIIAVIACSCCIGLSIRQAADDAKQSTMEGMSIEAEISIDRNAMMEGMKSDDGGMDKTDFKGFDSVSLELDEMLTYAKLSTVSDFYYSINSALNSDSIEAIQTNNRSEAPDMDENTEESENEQNMQMPGGMGGQMPGGMGADMKDPVFGTSGDFTLIGYSGEAAMTDFIDGNSSISEGVIFEEGTTENECIISDELATYNDISVGDEIVLYNPNDEEETYTLQVVGLYTNSQSTSGMGMMMQSDPANNIYMSYEALNAMVEASKETASTSTNQFGMEISNAISGDISGTYVFDDVEAYEAFEEDVYEAGLSEEFKVSSTDIQNYEQSLVPLETLSKTAGYFLVVILAIGALVLVVLNMFSIRERKYEVGVLTAIGMKKYKVACQFLMEILFVTLVAVIIGAAAGAISSVPVADALLENQIASQQQLSDNAEEAFGRAPGAMNDGMGNGSVPDDVPSDDGKGKGNKGGFMDIPGMEQTMNYVTDISATVNLTVLAQLLGICILLALVSGAVSVITIMRYEPLKILSNRD